MTSDLIKLIAATGLNGLWAALVFTGKADAMPLVAAIGTQITTLLGYHAITTLQATSPKQ